MNKDINRLKVVLAEKKRTNKWLAEQLIAKIMEVDIRELLIPTDTQKVIISIL